MDKSHDISIGLDKTEGKLMSDHNNIYGKDEEEKKEEEESKSELHDEEEENIISQKHSESVGVNLLSDVDPDNNIPVHKIVKPDIGRVLTSSERKWIDIMIKHNIIKEPTLVYLRKMK